MRRHSPCLCVVTHSKLIKTIIARINKSSSHPASALVPHPAEMQKFSAGHGARRCSINFLECFGFFFYMSNKAPLLLFTKGGGALLALCLATTIFMLHNYCCSRPHHHSVLLFLLLLLPPPLLPTSPWMAEWENTGITPTLEPPSLCTRMASLEQTS